MKMSDAIKAAMKVTHTTQSQLAERIGLAAGQSGIARRLHMDNISVNVVLEMLDAIGYEMVIQEKKRGRRAEGQMVITLEDGNDDV